MRLSTHTRILPIIKANEAVDDAHALLVNGLYGAMDVVDIQEASALAAGRACSDQVLEVRLLRRGHLTDESPHEEEGALYFLSQFNRMRRHRITAFDIIPTYDCNFRCPYCFENHRLAKGEGWLSYRMSAEVLNAFITIAYAITHRQYMTKSSGGDGRCNCSKPGNAVRRPLSDLVH